MCGIARRLVGKRYSCLRQPSLSAFKEILGNVNGNGLVKQIFLPPFRAHFVKFNPKECKTANRCCMRVEIYVSGKDILMKDIFLSEAIGVANSFCHFLLDSI